MNKSLTLALYLATRSRADRPDGPDVPGLDETEKRYKKERLGHATKDRQPGGPLIWIHTGQDSEGLAARELATRMKTERDDLRFLMTTGAEDRQKSNTCVISQLIPDESLPAIRRFLNHWKPDVAVFTEPDLRPALITEATRTNIPLFLIDANTAKPDPHIRRWLRGMTGSLLSRFQAVMTGSAESAAALKRLGAEPAKLEISGYLEEGTPALQCNDSDRDVLARALAARPAWLAAQVTAGECAAVIQAHIRAQRRAHRLLLILVPDQITDASVWSQALTADGHRVALRSAGEEPAPDTQIYIADTDGEMGLWYRLAPIAYLGKSSGPGGGINPYEPAALGSAIIHGPDVPKYRAAYDKLARAGAAHLVQSPDDLSAAVEQLLSPDRAAKLAHNAWMVCSAGAEVTDRVRDLIFAALEARETA